MAAEERFDEILTQVAGQLGGIEPLFDTLFSFLYRKTDYFHVMQPGDKMGFRAGVAQQILLRSFKKYEQAATAATRRAERPQQGVPPLAEPSKPSKPAPTAAATATATKGGTPTATAAPKAVAADAAAPKAPSARTNKSPEDAAEVPPGGTSDGGAAPASVAVAVAEGSAAAPAASATSAGARVVSAAGAKSASHLAEQVGVPYNGGRTAAYYWEQTLSDVTIHAPVPAGTRARDVICTISRNHLFLKLRAAGADAPIVDADFPCDARNGQEVWERVKAVESYWNLGEVDGGPCVSVYLEKERESWWKSAVDGGEEIDTTKVDSTRDMYDYDAETQGAIRKIMFDQHQKRMGQPTSEEISNEEMLRKAWDAEGSPFAGTPFDPSAVSFGGGGASGGGGGGGVPGLPPPAPGQPSSADVSDGPEGDLAS